MTSLESYRKLLLKQQTELRRMMMSFDQHDRVMKLFFDQHSMLHSAKITPAGGWSFEDAILDDMTEAQVRRIPQDEDHSAAWLLWHTARCEDITLNMLVAGSPQVLDLGGWLQRLKITVRDTGNAMDKQEMANFGNSVDIQELRGYRLAVGVRTQEIVRGLGPADLRQKVNPARLQRVTDEGAVVPAAHGIIEYWGRRNFAGLLLMPATRHNIIHLNEALQVKRKLL